MHSKTPHMPKVPAPLPQAPAEPPHTRIGLLKRGPRKRVLIIGGAVTAVLVLLLVAINVLISADWVEARVAARIKEQTGRDLTVNGSTILLFTPGPHVIITDAKISDPEASAGTADISVARLTIDLSYSELFSHKVDAERVVLVRPVVTVRVGDEAKPFRAGEVDETPKQIRFAKADAGGGEAKPRQEMRIKEMQIEDGTLVIIYDDKDDNAVKRIENINAELRLPSITARLLGKGTFDWKNQAVAFSFEVTTPEDLRAKRPARFQLAIDTKAISARFDGKLSTDPHFSGQGHLAAKSSSIPSVLAWMREAPDVSSAIGDGELASDVSWSQGEITFSNARFALEHASGQGQAAITLKSPRPYVRAALAIEHLDLNPFLASAKQRAGAAPNVKADEPAALALKPATEPTKDWFSKPDAAVIAVAPPPETAAPSAEAPANSDSATVAPVPTSVVASVDAARVAQPASFDADVNLNVRKTRIGHLDIGASSLGVVFHDGVMTATLGGMDLYEGHGNGTLVIDASKPIPTFSADFKLEGVQAQPLLSDAAQFTMIGGRTKLALNLEGSGEDADAIKSSLQGQASALVTDGAIEGIDLTAFISGLGEGDFDLRRGPDAKTAFSNLGGSFAIADGIAETHNLKMLSPLLEVMAEGTVDIPGSSLDILAHPEVVAGPEGKPGANDLAGLAVPVRIEGPLDGPRIKPEIKSVLANPEAASKTMNAIGDALQKKFKGKPVGEAIGRFLGNVQIGTPKQGPAPRAQSAAPEPDQGDADDDDEMDPDLKEILR